jgi:hypothetical protein
MLLTRAHISFNPDRQTDKVSTQFSCFIEKNPANKIFYGFYFPRRTAIIFCRYQKNIIQRTRERRTKNLKAGKYYSTYLSIIYNIFRSRSKRK